MEVGIGKFLIDLDITNIFCTKIMWSGTMLVPGWLSISLHYNNGLHVIMD